MDVEILPALRALVRDWVVKKDPATAPCCLMPEDISQLAEASVETLMQRALGTQETVWGPLEQMTRGWIVQRQRGDLPGRLGEADYRHIMRFVLDGLAQTPATPDEAPEALAAYIPETEDTLPDGRRIADVLKEDPFYFAREHLAQFL